MRRGYLSEYLPEIAIKRLSAVEASLHRSNQHEFNGVNALKRILGEERRSFPALFVYLDDDGDPLKEEGFLTWYDAREAHPTRSEYRLYFPTTVVSDRANEGDLFVIARRPEGSLLVIVAAGGSTMENQLLWLFGGGDLVQPGYSIRGEGEGDEIRVDFISRYILDQIGLEAEETDENFLEFMLREFGGVFPATRIFSAYARSTLQTASSSDSPDELIMAWMEREEILFRTLERHLIADRLRHGFDGDVDGFIAFSLSVQNRRKARAGSALENHLEHIFVLNGIRYSRTAVTEGKSKPDFLFPGKTEYHDPGFTPEFLTMLGVKSSCKDRWRQVLAEADRVADKHLLTLEPGISESQTSEMRGKRLQLVLPRRIHQSYSSEQRRHLIDLSQFMDLIADRQRKLL